MTTQPVPTLIRGKLYPSQNAAARALGVHHSTIWQALDRGTLDVVGLNARGRPGKPCYMNGKRWKSHAAAAKALDVSSVAISNAIASGRTYVSPGPNAEARNG